MYCPEPFPPQHTRSNESTHGVHTLLGRFPSVSADGSANCSVNGTFCSACSYERPAMQRFHCKQRSACFTPVPLATKSGSILCAYTRQPGYVSGRASFSTQAFILDLNRFVRLAWPFALITRHCEVLFEERLSLPVFVDPDALGVGKCTNSKRWYNKAARCPSLK